MRQKKLDCVCGYFPPGIEPGNQLATGSWKSGAKVSTQLSQQCCGVNYGYLLSSRVTEFCMHIIHYCTGVCMLHVHAYSLIPRLLPTRCKKKHVRTFFNSPFHLVLSLSLLFLSPLSPLSSLSPLSLPSLSPLSPLSLPSFSPLSPLSSLPLPSFSPCTGGYTASCAAMSYPDIGAVVRYTQRLGSQWMHDHISLSSLLLTPLCTVEPRLSNPQLSDQ